jgi:hypothetical protein
MALPKIRTCLVCEAVRAEVGGKWTLLGFFGVTPDVQVSIANFAFPVTLCFAFVGGDGSGRVRASIRVLTPSGKEISGTAVDGELAPGKLASMFFMNFQSVLPGAGRYTVVLDMNGQEGYRDTFSLAQGTPQAVS